MPRDAVHPDPTDASLSGSDKLKPQGPPLARRASFWALVLAALGIGVLFFQFIRPFFAALFFATVLAVLFQPLFHRLTGLFGGRHRLAALATVLALLVLLIAIGGLLMLVGREIMATSQDLTQLADADVPLLRHIGRWVEHYFPTMDWEELRKSAESGIEAYATATLRRTGEFLTDAVQLVVGAAIMVLALYYFLAEGNDILNSLQAISPFAKDDEWLLFRKFAIISRGVVVGIFVCAVAQALLLAVGLYFAGVERLWTLTGLTLLLSMVPFIGSAGVWVPVSVWLLWQGQIVTGALLALYGVSVVSTSDNLIRAYILHNSAKMHPLMALVSALGALQIVGLWGIFLGPVVAAFFYSILKILHDRLSDHETA